MTPDLIPIRFLIMQLRKQIEELEWQGDHPSLPVLRSQLADCLREQAEGKTYMPTF
jgi:hypothetical protein